MLKAANTKTQQRKNRTKNILTIIVVVVTVLIVGGLVTYVAIYNHNKALSAQSGDGNSADTNNPDINTAYYNEVHYVGGIGYKDVYEFSFDEGYKQDFMRGTSETYISNKDLWNTLGETEINKIVDITKGFAKDAFNISYRSLQSDPETYKNALLPYIHERCLFTTVDSNGEEFEMTGSFLLDEVTNYLVDNYVTCEAEFKTDASLVYKADGYYVVRGVLELSMYGDAKDGSFFTFEGDKGDKIPIMISFKLYPTRDQQSYSIVDIGRGIILKDDTLYWWLDKMWQGDDLHQL